MIEEPVEFSNQNIRLKGTLYKPDSGGPHPVMVVLHGATGGLRNYSILYASPDPIASTRYCRARL